MISCERQDFAKTRVQDESTGYGESVWLVAQDYNVRNLAVRGRVVCQRLGDWRGAILANLFRGERDQQRRSGQSE